ncbi:substrate-binding domain-containing protein [Nocardia blacklockiae]|uniref:substrate-binding domain-containing protein n=1 Tax=Nocardia blacklockiae TaxID=480036 RepID=UPI001893A464|nr:substrate-binding domain-containing protein [Nocardia blacklockiae]MBF6176309.1 substrate-binding domain-containing protein [Nocardia blacklockiae]
MGTHRSASGSRGVSKGLVVSVVAALLVVAAVGGWFWLRGHSASSDRTAAGECVEGQTTLPVTVDPDIAAPVRAAAERYNATQPKVRDHCVSVTVAARPSAAVVAAFTAGHWDSALGTQPALWIPDSSRSIEQMRVPGLIEGAPASVASSPIVLAVPERLRQALEQEKIGWAELPRLQQGSLADVGLNDWGGLRMALPAGDAGLAAALAVGSNVSGADPLDDEGARSGQVVSAISVLAADAPKSEGPTGALASLVGAQGEASNAVHATAVTEQQLRTVGGATAFRPDGAKTPVADFPAALLTGSWVDKTQNLVAGIFADYLRAPDQQKLFADNGFDGALPVAAAVPPKSTLDQVKSVLANPVLGVQSTVLLDTSAAMGATDGSLTRLANTLGALQSTMDTMPPDFGLGVWTYAGEQGGGNPYQVVSETAPLSQQHRVELAKSLGNVTATTSRTDRTYPALEAAYRSAVSGHAAHRTNSILLITGGPNDDSAITGDKLISDITAATDPAHPVRIDVIVVGGQGTPTLQTLAQQTGGTYTRVAGSNDLTFGTAVMKALTTT